MRVSRKALIETLRSCDGIPSQTARALGISPQAVRKRIRTDKVLQAVADEARESLIDLAQSKLRPAIEEGDFRAVKFVLETLGKGRGFGNQVKIDSDDKPGVMHLYFPDDGRDKPDTLNVTARQPERTQPDGYVQSPLNEPLPEVLTPTPKGLTNDEH